MVEKEKGFDYSIKGKLISAIAMLMVAVIMVVSSTYAWFTLSTAPEVTGISTAVGANGALEMLLATKDAAGNWIYNSGIVGDNDANTFWGNLVDLAKDPDKNRDYGVNLITLYPSALNATDGTIDLEHPISIPSYGADGRVTKVDSAATTFGTFRNGSFVPAGNTDYGYRALGVISGLTEREQAFKSTLSAINTAKNKGLSAARSSLNDNGNTLGAIAIAKAMNGDAASFTQKDVDAITAMINGLKTSLLNLENAYINAIAAVVLGSGNDKAETDAIAIAAANAIKAKAEIKEDSVPGKRLEEVLGMLDEYGVKSSAEELLKTYGYGEGLTFNKAVASLNTAESKIPSGKETYTWAELSPALTPLVDTSKLNINGHTVAEVKENMSDIVSAALGEGIKVVIPTGGGVYADIADLCADYTVSIKLDVTYNGLTVNDLPASMIADSTANDEYLNKLRDTIDSTLYPTPKEGSNADLPLTDFYGYVIDLAFKTNAAASDLLLQYDAKDRIYSDNNNEATMGGGSTMTFEAAEDMTRTQIEKLMSSICVVFFDTNNGKIYAEARLDTSSVELGLDGYTAQLKIYETYANKFEYEKSGVKTTLYYNSSDESYYEKEDFSGSSFDVSDGGTLTQIKGAFVDQENATISALNQNVELHVSALVYLDGNSITNSDVSATGDYSLSGTLNLQFASSATLVPMEYGDLHTPNGSTESSNP